MYRNNRISPCDLNKALEACIWDEEWDLNGNTKEQCDTVTSGSCRQHALLSLIHRDSADLAELANVLSPPIVDAQRRRQRSICFAPIQHAQLSVNIRYGNNQ